MSCLPGKQPEGPDGALLLLFLPPCHGWKRQGEGVAVKAHAEEELLLVMWVVMSVVVVVVVVVGGGCEWWWL